MDRLEEARGRRSSTASDRCHRPVHRPSCVGLQGAGRRMRGLERRSLARFASPARSGPVAVLFHGVLAESPRPCRERRSRETRLKPWGKKWYKGGSGEDLLVCCLL